VIEKMARKAGAAVAAAAQAAEEVRVYGPGGYDVYAAAMARVNPTSHILEPES
jgi:accessory colonization factor AcfC